MSNLTNYHSHCSYCDGRVPMEEYIEEAIRQGFTSYGISSHAPVPFPTNWAMKMEDVPAYLEEANLLKEKYAADIEIYVGMEIDYLDEKKNPSISFFQALPLDYRIGSVHLLHSLEGELVDIDVSRERFTELLPLYFGNDLKQLVLDYFHKNIVMIETGGFDIVGHADKVFFNASCCQPDLSEQDWYNKLMSEYFQLMKEKGCMIEINTKVYDKLGIFYPHIKYFPLLKSLNIPVMVNSDSHYPDFINSGRREALNALKENGIDSVMELHGGKWEECPIE